MEIKKLFSGRNIAVTAGLAALLIIAFVLVLKAYREEGEKRSAAISESGEKDPNHVEIFVKLISVDPLKGDASARLEFLPHGNLTTDEGATLSRDLKLFVNSATGKQEHVFEKGKRMNPVDATISLYDGMVTDYPFDQHSAELQLHITNAAKEQKDKDKPAATPAPTPTPQPTGEEGEEGEEGQKAQAQPPAKQEEAAADEGAAVPIAVDFFGSIHGLKVEAEKSKESDEDYVALEMRFSRASTVKFFSIFVMLVMWGVSIVVLLLTLAVALRGRKIEVGMFSFLSAAIFAFVALRNAQPGSPPIGSYSDYLSFFWAEIILALCLLTIVAIWVARPQK